MKKLQLAEQELNPVELLSGADLIQLGMTPGPAFSNVLTTVRDQQLLSNITTKVEAECWHVQLINPFIPNEYPSWNRQTTSKLLSRWGHIL